MPEIRPDKADVRSVVSGFMMMRSQGKHAYRCHRQVQENFTECFEGYWPFTAAVQKQQQVVLLVPAMDAKKPTNFVYDRDQHYHKHMKYRQKMPDFCHA